MSTSINSLFCWDMLVFPEDVRLVSVPDKQQGVEELIFCLPVVSYAFDSDHTNLTLQNMLDWVVKDLNELATAGLDINGEVPGDSSLLHPVCIFVSLCLWLLYRP